MEKEVHQMCVDSFNFWGANTGSFLCFFCEMFGWFLSLKSCGKMIQCLNFLILSVFLFSAHILIFSDFFWNSTLVVTILRFQSSLHSFTEIMPPWIWPWNHPRMQSWWQMKISFGDCFEPKKMVVFLASWVVVGVPIQWTPLNFTYLKGPQNRWLAGTKRKVD